MPKNLTYDNTSACYVPYGATPAYTAYTKKGEFPMQGRKLNPMLKAADLEDIADHLWCAISTVDAVHTAMTDSHDDPSSYTDALLGAVLLLRNVYDNLEKQVYLPEGLPHDF